METTDDVIDDFMGGKPRANQWRELRLALEARLIDARGELKLLSVTSPGYKLLVRKVKDMTNQVNVLVQEEAVAQFVEDSVVATVSRPHPLEIQNEFEM